MGTIFVAYGGPNHPNRVLEFAVDQAAASEYDLLVYHVEEDVEESIQEIREEIETVVEKSVPEITYSVEIDTRDEVSDQTNVSKQKRLTDALLDSDREFEYVVMGDIQRTSLEGLTHASMTRAVLELHSFPVLLVPV